MDATTERELIGQAIAARENAYAKYSNFQVGAAVLCSSGAIYSGCNVENGVLGLTICAERVAICRAVAEGEREFVAIAVAASPLASPCGSCRQFMTEFCDDLLILACDAGEQRIVKTWQLSELLPHRFRFEGDGT